MEIKIVRVLASSFMGYFTVIYSGARLMFLQRTIKKVLLVGLMLCIGTIIYPAGGAFSSSDDDLFVEQMFEPEWSGTKEDFERLPYDLQNIILEELLVKNNNSVEKTFIYAAKNNLLWAIQPLLKQGMNIRGALISAVSDGHTAAVALLIDVGAHIDDVDLFGDSALMVAAHSGYTAIVELLIAAGAQIDIINRHDGDTALGYAIKKCHVEIVQMLINEHYNQLKKRLEQKYIAINMLNPRGSANLSPLENLPFEVMAQQIAGYLGVADLARLRETSSCCHSHVGLAFKAKRIESIMKELEEKLIGFIKSAIAESQVKIDQRGRIRNNTEETVKLLQDELVKAESELEKVKSELERGESLNLFAGRLGEMKRRVCALATNNEEGAVNVALRSGCAVAQVRNIAAAGQQQRDADAPVRRVGRKKRTRAVVNLEELSSVSELENGFDSEDESARKKPRVTMGVRCAVAAELQQARDVASVEALLCAVAAMVDLEDLSSVSELENRFVREDESARKEPRVTMGVRCAVAAGLQQARDVAPAGALLCAVAAMGQQAEEEIMPGCAMVQARNAAAHQARQAARHEQVEIDRGIGAPTVEAQGYEGRQAEDSAVRRARMVAAALKRNAK